MISVSSGRVITLRTFHCGISHRLGRRQLSTVCGCASYFQKSTIDREHGKTSHRLALYSGSSPFVFYCQKRYNSGGNELRELRISFITKHFGEDVIPIKCLRTCLDYVHDTVGLPWWATIFLATIGFKSVLTLPLAVLTIKNNNRMILLNPKLQEKIMAMRQELEQYDNLMKRMSHSKTGMPEEEKKRLYYKNRKRLKRKFYIKHNIHPLKGFATIFTQFPLWVYLSFTIRHLCGGFILFPTSGTHYSDRVIHAPSMTTEGLLWFQDFTIPDPTMILPIILCLTNLLNTQLFIWNAKKDNRQLGRLAKVYIVVTRCYSLVMIPLGAVVPSALVYYWLISSMFSLVQNVALRDPRVMAIFGIPEIPNTPSPLPTEIPKKDGAEEKQAEGEEEKMKVEKKTENFENFTKISKEDLSKEGKTDNYENVMKMSKEELNKVGRTEKYENEYWSNRLRERMTWAKKKLSLGATGMIQDSDTDMKKESEERDKLAKGPSERKLAEKERKRNLKEKKLAQVEKLEEAEKKIERN